MGINFTQIISIFFVIFALIDVLGSIPIFINFRAKGLDFNPLHVSGYSLVILIAFLFVGNWILKMFHIDVSSFAIAGALIVLIIAIEMVFGIEIFKSDAPKGSSTLVPVVFPLIAGPATLTALLSMRAEYEVINLIIAIVLNVIIVYFVLNNLNKVERVIGTSGIYIMRKFFGVILMAIAVKLFITNLGIIISSFSN